MTTSGRVLYLDLVGGVAGDMLLAALLDAGAPVESVRSALAALPLDGVELEVVEVWPAGLRAKRVDVLVRGVLGDAGTIEGSPSIRVPFAAAAGSPLAGPPHRHRPWRDIDALLAAAPLPERARALAQAAFRRLAEAEGAAHGVPLEAVELHEVGADDAIADIVGVAVAFDALDVERVVASPFPLGRALVRGAHGPIPIPGPAVLELLRGAPIVETPLGSETVTPTGAALVRALASSFGPLPSMTLERVGTGAGHKTWPDRPNVVRAVLGRSSTPLPATRADDEIVVETNLDDMSPEHVDPLLEALYAAGAVDAWAQPALFKKGRPGLVVAALASAGREEAIARAFFRHSPTLGVRIRPVARLRLDRTIEQVETPYGPIRVKRSRRPDAPDLLKPEHDDVRAAAARAGVALREVEEAALRAAVHDSGPEGRGRVGPTR